MLSNTQQIITLLKKDWLLLKQSKGFVFGELFPPLMSIYLVAMPKIFGYDQKESFDVGPLAIPMFVLVIGITLTFNIVSEKALNIKEYLRVNGAQLYNYLIAAFSFYLIRAIIAATILFIGVVFVGTGSSNTGDRLLGYLNLIVYCVAFINFNLSLTTLFSSARLAAQLVSLLTLMVTFVYYPVTQSSAQVWYYLSSLLPPLAAAYGFSLTSSEKNLVFSPTKAIIMQVVNCFLYFGLFLFLDRIVPSSSGIKDPICKCRKRARKTQSKIQEMTHLDVEAGLNNQPLMKNVTAEKKPKSEHEDISSAELHEPFYNPSDLRRTVFIENLTKIFGKSVAVDHVTIPMFEHQIFCLLGHNGAGKTTTINLMTGLLRPEEGSVFYDGEDFSDNYEQVRSKFGVCLQKDVLYENLTPAQHIELISRLRGIPKNNIPNYIEVLSDKVGIQSELDKKAGALSGGNKRKLSLALAIAGDPKVIFLDEPTAGLDPNARRNFWDIVRALRDEGKTILLTTHNLDEADELADRIAILSKGKLLILGTSNFLKKKYGVGYNLIITPRPDAVQDFYPNKDRYIQLVKRLVKTSELDSKTSAEMIKMTLPYEESQHFAELFGGLEKEPQIEANFL